MFIKKIVVGNFATNCYLVKAQSNQGLIIDPGADGEQILKAIAEDDLVVKGIILTHGHFDHIGAVDVIRRETGAEVMIHQGDQEALVNPQRNLSFFGGEGLAVQAADRLLNEGELVEIGPNLSFTVLSTPGHSPGGICLYHQQAGVLFSGDTIFAMGIGRTDFPYSEKDQLMGSIRDKLLDLPKETRVYSGHGPETTIGEFEEYYRSVLLPRL